MKTIQEKQQDLLNQLMAEKREQAQKQKILVSAKEGEGIFVHPLHQTPYRWAGKDLVAIGPRYLDDVDTNLSSKIKNKIKSLLSMFYPSQSLGQSPTVLDPWGKPTTGLPISVRREIEWEEAERRAHCRYAPFSNECQGYLGDYGYDAYVYRVDNLITGRTRFPVYAIPYRDKFGIQHLATGKKHPHLAVNALKRKANEGTLGTTCKDFDPEMYGFDHKLFIYKTTI